MTIISIYMVSSVSLYVVRCRKSGSARCPGWPAFTTMPVTHSSVLASIYGMLGVTVDSQALPSYNPSPASSVQCPLTFSAGLTVCIARLPTHWAIVGSEATASETHASSLQSARLYVHVGALPGAMQWNVHVYNMSVLYWVLMRLRRACLVTRF